MHVRDTRLQYLANVHLRLIPHALLLSIQNIYMINVQKFTIIGNLGATTFLFKINIYLFT